MIAQVLFSGLLIGGIYALVAIGLNLIFGVMRIINFAHGEFLMISMYGAYWLWRGGVDPYMSVLIIVPGMVLFGMFVERYLIRRTLRAHAHVKIFVTLGISLVLQNLALLLFSANYLSVKTPYQTDVLSLAGLSVSVPRLVAFCVMLMTALGLYLFLQKTATGKAIRAAAQDKAAAQLMGINVNRIHSITFALGSALTGLAACLLMPVYFVFPTVGIEFVLVAFVVVVLGGLGSLPGAVIGGLLIGVVEQLSGYLVEGSLKQLVYFAIFIVVIALKPSGLLGQRGAEEMGLK